MARRPPPDAGVVRVEWACLVGGQYPRATYDAASDLLHDAWQRGRAYDYKTGATFAWVEGRAGKVFAKVVQAVTALLGKPLR